MCARLAALRSARVSVGASGAKSFAPDIGVITGMHQSRWDFCTKCHVGSVSDTCVGLCLWVFLSIVVIIIIVVAVVVIIKDNISDSLNVGTIFNITRKS